MIPSLNRSRIGKEHDCNIGFGKKYALRNLGVWRGHFEPLMVGSYCVS